MNLARTFSTETPERGWDSRFTLGEIPEYNALNDRYCKFWKKKAAKANRNRLNDGWQAQTVGAPSAHPAFDQMHQRPPFAKPLMAFQNSGPAAPQAGQQMMGLGMGGGGGAGMGMGIGMGPMGAMGGMGGMGMGGNMGMGMGVPLSMGAGMSPLSMADTQPPAAERHAATEPPRRRASAENTHKMATLPPDNVVQPARPPQVLTANDLRRPHRMTKAAGHPQQAVPEPLSTGAASQGAVGVGSADEGLDRRPQQLHIEKMIEVREGFLYLLQELAERTQGQGVLDREQTLKELTHTLSSLRNSTLDCVEAIGSWEAQTGATYLWKGVGYLAKLQTDVNFFGTCRAAQLLDYSVVNNPLLVRSDASRHKGGAGGVLPPVAGKGKDHAGLSKNDPLGERMAQAEKLLKKAGGDAGDEVEEEAYLAILEEDEPRDVEDEGEVPEDDWLARTEDRSKEVEHHAALDIQRVYRGFRDRRRAQAVRRKRRAAVRLQKFARMVHAKNEVGRLRGRRGAAIRLQALQRGILDRQRVQQLRLEKYAATAVQRTFRGHVGRKAAGRKRVEREAATKIQQTWRGYSTRRRLRTARSTHRHAGAVLIQKVWRGYAVRSDSRYSRKKLVAVITLQAWGRGIIGRRITEQRRVRHRAAVRIQSWLRGCHGRGRVVALRRARAAAQTGDLHDTIDRSATVIQAGWRGHTARREYARRLSEQQRSVSAEVLEAQRKAVREEVSQLVSKDTVDDAATRIQCAVRMWLAFRCVAMLRALHTTATTIQRVVRGHQGRKAAGRRRRDVGPRSHVRDQHERMLAEVDHVAALRVQEQQEAALAERAAAESEEEDQLPQAAASTVSAQQVDAAVMKCESMFFCGASDDSALDDGTDADSDVPAFRADSLLGESDPVVPPPSQDVPAGADAPVAAAPSPDTPAGVAQDADRPADVVEEAHPPSATPKHTAAAADGAAGVGVEEAVPCVGGEPSAIPEAKADTPTHTAPPAAPGPVPEPEPEAEAEAAAAEAEDAPPTPQAEAILPAETPVVQQTPEPAAAVPPRAAQADPSPVQRCWRSYAARRRHRVLRETRRLQVRKLAAGARVQEQERACAVLRQFAAVIAAKDRKVSQRYTRSLAAQACARRARAQERACSAVLLQCWTRRLLTRARVAQRKQEQKRARDLANASALRAEADAAVLVIQRVGRAALSRRRPRLPSLRVRFSEGVVINFPTPRLSPRDDADPSAIQRAWRCFAARRRRRQARYNRNQSRAEASSRAYLAEQTSAHQMIRTLLPFAQAKRRRDKAAVLRERQRQQEQAAAARQEVAYAAAILQRVGRACVGRASTSSAIGALDFLMQLCGSSSNVMALQQAAKEPGCPTTLSPDKESPAGSDRSVSALQCLFLAREGHPALECLDLLRGIGEDMSDPSPAGLPADAVPQPGNHADQIRALSLMELDDIYEVMSIGSFASPHAHVHDLDDLLGASPVCAQGPPALRKKEPSPHDSAPCAEKPLVADIDQLVEKRTEERTRELQDMLLQMQQRLDVLEKQQQPAEVPNQAEAEAGAAEQVAVVPKEALPTEGAGVCEGAAAQAARADVDEGVVVAAPAAVEEVLPEDTSALEAKILQAAEADAVRIGAEGQRAADRKEASRRHSAEQAALARQEQDAAALTIQCKYRQMHARARMDERRREQEAEAEAEDGVEMARAEEAAALQIQRGWGAKAERLRAGRIKAVTLIQTMFRGHRARREAKQRRQEQAVPAQGAAPPCAADVVPQQAVEKAEEEEKQKDIVPAEVADPTAVVAVAQDSPAADEVATAKETTTPTAATHAPAPAAAPTPPSPERTQAAEEGQEPTEAELVEQQHAAASCIQRCWRCYNARFEARWRRDRKQERVLEAKQGKSAVAIQSGWRSHEARKEVGRRREAQHERKQRALEEERERESAEESAADRNRLVEQELEEQQRLHRAAAMVQRCYKCYNARFMLQWKRRDRAERRARDKKAEEDALNAVAATRIQCMYREWKARKVRRSRAASHDASKALKAAEEERLELAATKIQCAYRCFNARFEAAWRAERREALGAAQQARKETEAKDLQARRARAESERQTQARRERAALVVQCAWRCYNARFQRSWMYSKKGQKEREKTEAAERAKAACVIQRGARLQQAKAERERRKEQRDLMREQRLCVAEEERMAQQRDAATVVQSMVRRMQAKRAAGQKREERHQRLLDQLIPERRHRAAIKIQCMYRSRIARFELEYRRLVERNDVAEEKKYELDNQAVRIQAQYRGRLARKDAERRREAKRIGEENTAATKIQSNWRGKHGRSEVARQRAERAAAEEAAAEAAAKEQDEAAAKIQGEWRGRRERAAQTAARLAAEEEELQHTRQAAEEEAASVKIQSQWRGHRTRQEQQAAFDARQRDTLAQEEGAATRIQAQWRGHQTRAHRASQASTGSASAAAAAQEREYEAVLQDESATKIQAQWRGHHARAHQPGEGSGGSAAEAAAAQEREYEAALQNQSATMIQSQWRGKQARDTAADKAALHTVLKGLLEEQAQQREAIESDASLSCDQLRKADKVWREERAALHAAAVRLQAAFRGFRARNRVLELEYQLHMRAALEGGSE